jgi:hypothetical protein
MMAVSFLLVIGTACGGAAGGDDTPADATAVTPLTCSSIALCTTYDVKTFLGDVPAPAGGTIKDGIYRRAYTLIPDDVGETAGYSDDLDALEIRQGTFNWAGFFRDAVGTIASSGDTITFHETRNCEGGRDGSPSTQAFEYRYTATGSELRFYSHVTRSDGVEWDKMHVYVLVGSPQDVCRTVGSEPSAPGDSARCNVINCACSFAVEGTVNECT